MIHDLSLPDLIFARMNLNERIIVEAQIE